MWVRLPLPDIDTPIREFTFVVCDPDELRVFRFETPGG
jgi:hypothetical protein